MSDSKRRRYPGVQPFSEAQTDLFFGRQQDINDLFRLMTREKLVVLFGRSGYGKSSILQAGIIPALRHNPVVELEEGGDEVRHFYQPVVIRFGVWAEGASLPPVEKIVENLQAPPVAEGGFLLDWLNQRRLPHTLWATFKERQAANAGHYVLIFDQFEEFFTYPAEQQYAFRTELAELLYQRTPPAVREHWDTLSKEQRSFVSRPLNVRAVFAIRSDRMSELDSLKTELPAILQQRYELRALNREQAREAIIRPARLEDRFASSRFEFTEDGVSAMLAGLTEGADPTRGEGIEAFQLQILCENIEAMVMAGKIPDRDGNGLPDVTPDDLPDFKNLYTAYYRRKLDELPESDREPAELLLQGLVQLDEATGAARRRTMDRDYLLEIGTAAGAKPELLERLKNTFLVREESLRPGVSHFEISHDTLLPPIVEAKKERRAIEAEREAEAARAKAVEEERRRQDSEDLRRKAEAEKNKAQRNARLALGLTGLALLALVVAMLFYSNAKRAEAKAEAEKNTADSLRSETQKAYENLLDSQAKQDSFEIDALKSRAAVLFANGFFRSAKDLYEKAHTFADKYPDIPDMQAERKRLDKQIAACAAKL